MTDENMGPNEAGSNPLVEVKDGKVIATSLRVAEVFGKRHADALRSIQRLECSEDFRQRNFAFAEYLDEQGKPRPMVEMTRDGWSFLVMGFTGAEAAAWKERYISQFNAMEAALRSDGDHELSARTNGIARMLAKKVTEQGRALERMCEILEASSLPARVEVPSGATLVRQHARRVSTDRDTGLRMKALVERLEKFFPPDAPPLIPPPFHGLQLRKIVGDAMEPTLNPRRDYALVRSVDRFDGEGIYFLFNGWGEEMYRADALSTVGYRLWRDNAAYGREAIDLPKPDFNRMVRAKIVFACKWQDDWWRGAA